MKKLIILFAAMIFTGFGFAQTAMVNGTAATLEANLSANFVEFQMPSEVTNSVVEKSAQYYTEYFTVNYNEESKIAKIILLNQEEQSKRVITRFLLSTGVRAVKFEEKEYTIMEFYSNFLD